MKPDCDQMSLSGGYYCTECRHPLTSFPNRLWACDRNQLAAARAPPTWVQACMQLHAAARPKGVANRHTALPTQHMTSSASASGPTQGHASHVCQVGESSKCSNHVCQMAESSKRSNHVCLKGESSECCHGAFTALMAIHLDLPGCAPQLPSRRTLHHTVQS